MPWATFSSVLLIECPSARVWFSSKATLPPGVKSARDAVRDLHDVPGWPACALRAVRASCWPLPGCVAACCGCGACVRITLHLLCLLRQVNVLTVFIESNQGDEDTTIVQKLALYGSGEEVVVGGGSSMQSAS